MRSNTRVSIKRCESYDKKDLSKAVRKCVSLLGGFKKFLSPASKILVKPNFLSAAAPEKAVTTHPLFIEAVIENIIAVTKNSKNILIADSFGPATPYNRSGMKRVYEATGVLDVAKRTGCRLNYSTEYESLSYRQGRIIKKIEIIKPVIEADVIINLPKFKTHNLTVITGAVKNMYGVVPGFTKVGYHLRFSEIKKFCGMLLDVAAFMKPALNIMDGITGVEGEGPGRSGTPRKVGLILASDDPISMDMVMSRIMNINPKLVTFFEILDERKDKYHREENIRILGEKISDIIIDDFKLPKSIGQKKLLENAFISTYIMPLVRGLLNPYPHIDSGKCSLCMVCRDICPQNSISYRAGKMKFNYKTCIRCFCCSEMCPEGAINTKFSFLGNLIFKRLELAGRLVKKE